MVRYSIQPRDQIFVKCYRFLSFAKNMCKNIGKNISKSLSGKYSPGMLDTREKLLDHAKWSVTYAPKTTLKKTNSRNSRSTGDLIGNKIANKITKVSKNSQRNNSKTATNENDKEISKQRYISPDENRKLLIILVLI